MSKLDERQFELQLALAGVTDHTPSDTPFCSCEEQMMESVIGAVGIHGGAAAAVYAEIVDLAVIMEVQRAGIGVTNEVRTLVVEFQRDAVALVVESELGSVGAD